MQDLIAGRIDYYCLGTSVAIPLIQSGMIKAIAILSKDRSPALPELPSAHEQGLANFNVGAWSAFFLPRDTPPPIVNKLNAATVAVMNLPVVQKQMKDAGAELVAPERRSPEYLAQFVRSEIDKWATAIKAAGITLN
jgi:tripartite-type tricarboxylate transporter receptor subunit TctC